MESEEWGALIPSVCQACMHPRRQWERVHGRGTTRANVLSLIVSPEVSALERNGGMVTVDKGARE